MYKYTNENEAVQMDEAAADHFLNWTYSKIYQGGFADINWGQDGCNIASPPQTCIDPSLPGQNRLRWMNITMTELIITLFSS